jgi:hypothetical protein
MERNFNTSTSLSYVSMKVRQHDAADAVSIGQIEGRNALVLEQSAPSGVYQTWIYYYDGALRELFTDRELADALEPSSGLAIVSVSDFEVSLEDDGLLRLTAVDHSGRSDLLVGLRSGGVA